MEAGATETETHLAAAHSLAGHPWIYGAEYSAAGSFQYRRCACGEYEKLENIDWPSLARNAAAKSD